MGLINLLVTGLFETILMVFASTFISVLMGVPFGIILFTFSSKGLKPMPAVYHISSFIVNIVRSIPFIILMILMLPITRVILGSGIGTTASIVPLSLGGIFLMARIVEDSFYGIPKGLKEIGISIGASNIQIINRIFLKESLPEIISGITLVIINMIGFSAMAGAIGGGGLGDLAIRYGYQRYNITLMIWIVIILVTLVQIIQFVGNYFVHRLRR